VLGAKVLTLFDLAVKRLRLSSYRLNKCFYFHHFFGRDRKR